MRQYKVFLKDAPEPLLISAEDVNLVSADGPSMGVFLNFWQFGGADAKGTRGEDFTVAAVPLEEVRYVTST
jgi:hypothetical protein